jgi:hypothetical protein
MVRDQHIRSKATLEGYRETWKCTRSPNQRALCLHLFSRCIYLIGMSLWPLWGNLSQTIATYYFGFPKYITRAQFVIFPRKRRAPPGSDCKSAPRGAAPLGHLLASAAYRLGLSIFRVMWGKWENNDLHLSFWYFHQTIHYFLASNLVLS